VRITSVANGGDCVIKGKSKGTILD